MFSIVGKLDKENQLSEGFNADHIIKFKVGKDAKTEEPTVEIIFSDGSKDTFKGNEAKVLLEKVLLKNFQVSLTEVSIGSANKMLNTLQSQLDKTKKKLEQEEKDRTKPTPAARPALRRGI